MSKSSMNASNHRLLITLFLVSGFLSGCGAFAYTNSPLRPSPAREVKASSHVARDRGSHHKTLVILALSGGGSRAAYWSAVSMLKLGEIFKAEGLDLLGEVDVISSVSGGSLPAAYFAISRDPQDDSGVVPSNRVWDEATVKSAMAKAYRTRWLLNWFWPYNALKFWFTAFDRTDIMAQTMADNLFDTHPLGHDLKFDDLNPTRPYLIINATNGTTSDAIDRGCSSSDQRIPPDDDRAPQFGGLFTFTAETFDTLGSDLGDYEVSRAVMASAAFPGVFNYMTLKDFARTDVDRCDRFRHVFDGGNRDNLGLDTVSEVIKLNGDQYDRVAVILVDSYIESQGVSSRIKDGRVFFDYVVDTDFLDSFDSLLSKVRYSSIDRLVSQIEGLQKAGKKAAFYHLKFDNVKAHSPKLFRQLNAISTDFNIDSDGTDAIDQAGDLLLTPNNNCLQEIRQVLTADTVTNGPPYCTYNLEP